ncbi:MAG: hypothetical protein ABEJ79_06075 [Halolamina sp.]
MSSDAADRSDRSADAGGVARGDGAGVASGNDAPAAAATNRPNASTTTESDTQESFGRRGWVLVGAVVTATLLVPAVIYAYPTLLAGRVPFVVAMLALPFVPAALLGAVAVWSMSTSSRRGDDGD